MDVYDISVDPIRFRFRPKCAGFLRSCTAEEQHYSPSRNSGKKITPRNTL